MHVASHAKISRIYDLVGTWVYDPISVFEKILLRDDLTLKNGFRMNASLVGESLHAKVSPCLWIRTVGKFPYTETCDGIVERQVDLTNFEHYL